MISAIRTSYRKSFPKKNSNSFTSKECDVQVRHSNKDFVKAPTEIILGATLTVGKHVYNSNWLIADFRCDLLLGMTWHVANNTFTNYKLRTVKANSDWLTTNRTEKKSNVQVMSLSVNKFRNMQKKKCECAGIQVFQLFQKKENYSESDESKEEMLNSASSS